MTDESIRDLIGTAVRGNSRGLTNCCVEVRPNSYDQKQHYMKKKYGYHWSGRLPIWNFVITRTDGTKIRLHPVWKGTTIEVFEPAEGTPHLVPAPMNGIGESDGPGTFKSFQRLQTTGMLRFDPEKQPHQEGRSRGRSCSRSRGPSRGAGTQAGVAGQPPPAQPQPQKDKTAAPPAKRPPPPPPPPHRAV